MRLVRELDRGVWNGFVIGHPDGNIFHTPDMFEVFLKAKGHVPSLWAALGKDGEVLALLLPVRIMLLGGFLQPLTTRAVVYGSVLHHPSPEGQEALASLLRLYNQEMRSRLLFTELRNLSDMSDCGGILQDSGFTYEEHLNFLIDLRQSPQEIWQGIRSNARRNVQKAIKSGVIVEEIEDVRGVSAAYTILRAVYRRLRVPLPDGSLFQSAYEALQPRGMLRLLKARVNGDDIGVLTLLLYKGVVLYWYTGTLSEYWQYRPSDLLVWHALEWGSRNGFHTFDFGGGGRPDEEYGVRDFKAKFGGRLVNFGRNKSVHAPTRLRVSEGGYQLVRRFL